MRVNSNVFISVAFVLLALAGTAFADPVPCVNLSDAGTYGTAVAWDGDTLYVNENTLLCTDNYNFMAGITRFNASGITLDCNGATLHNPGWMWNVPYGVLISGFNDTTVQNCNVDNYAYGIAIESGATGNLVLNNTFSGPMGTGIYLDYLSGGNQIINNTVANIYNYGIVSDAGNNVISGNTVSGSPYGIRVMDYNGIDMAGTVISGNTLSDIYYVDIDYRPSYNISNCNVVIENNTGSSGYPILYVANQPASVSGGTYAEIILCNASGSNIDGTTIIGSESHGSNGLYAWYTNDSTFTNTNSSGNYYGLYLYDSSNNNITYNTLSDEYTGLYLDSGADNNNVLYNTFDYDDAGFYLYEADNNQIGHNTVTNTDGNFGSSCPLIYPWNGESYYFASDFSITGRLATSKRGTKSTYNDYVKIPGAALAEDNGEYRMQVTEEYDELTYIDELALYTIDHSPDVDIYPGFLLANKSSIYTVSKTSQEVVSCTDEKSNDCLSAIAAKDGVYVNTPDGTGNNTVELNLGDLSGADSIKLIFTHAKLRDVNSATSLKYIQIRDAEGSWQNVYSDSDMIAPPNAPNTYVVDLTGKFAPGDYSVRLIFPESVLDYVAVDTSAQQPVTVTRLSPDSAELHYRGFSTKIGGMFDDFDYNTLSEMRTISPRGNLTRYGDVQPLLTETDDKYVIMKGGDEATVTFPYSAPEEGNERDFILYGYYYYKPEEKYHGNYTVTPLPFKAMSAYPYPKPEKYPTDAAHNEYLATYNTRISNTTSKRAGDLPDSFNNTVFENTIYGGDDEYAIGIRLSEEENTTLRDNTITGVGVGIDTYNSYGNVVLRNNISAVGGRGLLMRYDSSYGTYINNTILENNSDTCTYNDCGAVWIGQSSFNRLEGNTIVSDGSFGIYVGVRNYEYTAEGNNITGNSITSYSEYAIYLDGDGETYDNLFARNTITGNYWVDDETDGDNYFNDSYSGNVYYLENGTAAWEMYSITDENGDGWADSGDSIPFNYDNIGDESLWNDNGEDYHPAADASPITRTVNVSLMEPDEDGSPAVGTVPFTYNVSAFGDIAYCNLTVQNAHDGEIVPETQAGLAGLWHFNEDLLDASGNANDGTAVGGEFTNESKFGNSAYSFNGESDYVNVSNSEVLDITGPITISGWFYPVTDSNDAYVVGKIYWTDDYDNGGYALRQHNNMWEFDVANDQWGYSVLWESTQLDTWQNVVAVYDPNEGSPYTTIYINGVEQLINEQSPLPMSIKMTGLPLGFAHSEGDLSDNNNYWQGKMDEVAIYDRVLSADEVATLYRATYRNYSDTVEKDTAQELDLELPAGNYSWNVQCTDDSDVNGQSESRALEVGGSSCASEIEIDELPATLTCGAGTTYLLSDNFTYTDGNAITIAADNVTLDCQGNSIIGGGSYFGVDSDSVNGTVIMNCIISGFNDGIEFSNSSYGQILNNSLESNWRGLELGANYDGEMEQEFGSHHNLVTGNNFTGNGIGFYLYYSDNNQIGRNRVVNTDYQNFGSCPFAYLYNGTDYNYYTDLAGEVLGIPYYDTSKYTAGMYELGNFQPIDGVYKMKLREVIPETDYVDTARLAVVDVPKGYGVLSDWSNTYSFKQAPTINLLTIKDPIAPISAMDNHGNDVLSQVSGKDGVPVPIYNEVQNPIVLDFGVIEHPEYAKLLITGWGAYGRFSHLTSQPRLLVQTQDGNGNWVTRKQFGGFIGDSRTYAYNISDVVSQGNTRMRIVAPSVPLGIHIIDQVLLDDSVPVGYTVTYVDPSRADLQFGGSASYIYPTLSSRNMDVTDEHNAAKVDALMYGNFTKYGPVLPLLEAVDDKFVVMRHGDELMLEYPAPAQEEGTDRFALMNADVMYTIKYNVYGLVNDSADPVPFHGMTKYPYNLSVENYPSDEEHQTYLSEWNTRQFIAPEDGKKYGGSLPYSVNNTVYENVIIGGSDSSGLYLDFETNTTLRDNNISGVDDGIEVYSSSGTSIYRNRIFDNGDSGIIVDNSPDTVIENNTLINNSDYGIYNSDSTGSLIRNNTITLSEFGIYLIGNLEEYIVDANSVSESNEKGIYLEEETGSGPDAANSPTHAWRSQSVNNQETTLIRDIDLTDATTNATFKYYLWYATEDCCDMVGVYAYDPVGEGWDTVDEFYGESGSWEQNEIDLTPYIGQETQVKFTYETDGSSTYAGGFLDDFELDVDGESVWTDDVESGEGSWVSTLENGAQWEIYDFNGTDAAVKRITNNTLTNNTYAVHVYSGSPTLLNNTMQGYRWIYDEGSSAVYNDSTSGNKYYFANGSGAWTLYDITATSGHWADGGTDRPFNSSLESYEAACYQEGYDEYNTCGAQGGGYNSDGSWDNLDLVVDRDWSTGSEATDGSYFVNYYNTPDYATGATVIAASALETAEFELPSDCIPSDDTTYVKYTVANGEFQYIEVSCYNYDLEDYDPLGTFDGTAQLNETSINWTIDVYPWQGNGEDWHPYVGSSANVFGDGESIDVTGNGADDANITVQIDEETDVNGTAQDGVKEVTISNNGDPLFVFDYNFTGSELNFSQVEIEVGTTTGGKAYASISGIDSDSLNGTKTLYLYGASRSYNAVCVKDAEGISYVEISSSCDRTSEKKVVCNGNLQSGYRCTRDESTLIVTGLRHSAAIQMSDAGTSAGGTPLGGGAGIGTAPTSGTGSSTATYNVDKGQGVLCPVTIQRSMASTADSSVLTTTLYNAGGENCLLEEYRFTDTLPLEFSGAGSVAYAPSASSMNGREVVFAFPSFVQGESKVLTYSVGSWVKPSLASGFVNYSMAAKKIEAEVPPQPEENETEPVVEPIVPENKPPVQPPQTPVVVPEAQPDVVGGMAFIAILAAAVIVAAGIAFVVLRKRKKE